MLSEYFAKALKRWDLPLLGIVPDANYLSRHTMIDYQVLFDQKLLSGSPESELWHFDQTTLISMDCSNFMERLYNERHSKNLFVTHSSRADIILSFLSQRDTHQKRWGSSWRSGMILAGELPKYSLAPSIVDAISTQDQPILLSGKSTYGTMMAITNYTAKLNPKDVNRTIAAIEHYEDYINFDHILS